MDQRQSIEAFHLLFSHRLSAKVDRELFALKGGCNLRFFFRSIRYSEDIDFDVQKISVETLKKNVSKVIEDSGFASILKRSFRLEIVDWSAPKQTETTQRWKVALKVDGQALTIPTKIEFSRRSTVIQEAIVEPVPADIITEYKLQPVLIQHYPLIKALQQKLGALIYRTETQARDVIDLHILKGQMVGGSQALTLSAEEKKKALETLMSVSFFDYKSQVWPYLISSYQDYYGKESTWNNIQDEVVAFIEALKSGGDK